MADSTAEQKVLKGVKTAALILLIAVVGIILITTLGTMALSSFHSGVSGISNEMRNGANVLLHANLAVNLWTTSFTSVIITLLMKVILVVGIVALGMWILDGLKPKKPTEPAKAETKKEEPKK